MKNKTIKNIKDGRILIFGGTGSLGKTLIKRYCHKNLVCVYSRDESKHWTIKNEMNHKNLSFIIGDIRDKNRCLEALLEFKPTHVILASALKHVDVCENSPYESIKTNTLGIKNVVEVVANNKKYFKDMKAILMVSTDKACSPINVYGMCKAIAERLVTSQANKDHKKIKFLAVRYGNVLESRGSIIPLFKYQAEHKDSITVTHSDMTRYVMTLDESVDLINSCLVHGKSGETWVPKLPSMRIIDLAEIFSEKYEKLIKIVGMRPGEKLHESLVNETESFRAAESHGYITIMPAYCQPVNSSFFTLNSDDSGSLMSKAELKNHLIKLDILEKDLSEFVGKSIEEVKK